MKSSYFLSRWPTFSEKSITSNVQLTGDCICRMWCTIKTFVKHFNEKSRNSLLKCCHLHHLMIFFRGPWQRILQFFVKVSTLSTQGTRHSWFGRYSDSQISFLRAWHRSWQIRHPALLSKLRKLHPKGFRLLQMSTGPFAYHSLCLLCAGVAENANQPDFPLSRRFPSPARFWISRQKVAKIKEAELLTQWFTHR